MSAGLANARVVDAHYTSDFRLFGYRKIAMRTSCLPCPGISTGASGTCYCTSLVHSYLVYESQVTCYKVPYGISNIYCVEFTENASFFSFSAICFQPLPSRQVLDRQNKYRDSDGFFSRRLVCRSSDSSYNSTGSSLIIANCRQCFLPFFLDLDLAWHM